MKRSDGFFLVYSITSRDSFEESIPKFYKAIKKIKVKDFPLVVVGNKKDLEKDREVGYEEGEKLCKEYGCQFFETSAQSGEGVEKAFHQLIKDIKKMKAIEQPPTPKNK